jgi:hypothetical protein
MTPGSILEPHLVRGALVAPRTPAAPIHCHVLTDVHAPEHGAREEIKEARCAGRPRKPRPWRTFALHVVSPVSRRREAYARPGEVGPPFDDGGWRRIG